jgi:hypothetical protein
MASKFQPRSEGVNVTSDLPPTLHILLKKTPPKNNIVVGDDRAQIRFLEQRLSTDANKVEAVRVERVTDDMLAGYEGKLYHVSMKHKVDLSPELRGRTGVWAADPIVKCSPAINALVKFAATLIPGREKTLKREIVDRIGKDITKKGVRIATANIGPTPPSSSSKTTVRTAQITSMHAAPWGSLSAPTSNAVSSTALFTPPVPWCVPSNCSWTCLL